MISPLGFYRVVKDRFICAGDLRKRIHRGEIRATENGTPMLGGWIEMTDDELATIVSRAKLTLVKSDN